MHHHKTGRQNTSTMCSVKAHLVHMWILRFIINVAERREKSKGDVKRMTGI